MSRESDYIDFLIQEYKTLLHSKGFTEAAYLTSDGTSPVGPFFYAKGRSIMGRSYNRRFQLGQQLVYLHTSIVNQVVGWFWRDSSLWSDHIRYREDVGDCFFEGDLITRLDWGVSGGTPELLRHFLSKPSEEWLIKEEK